MSRTELFFLDNDPSPPEPPAPAADPAQDALLPATHLQALVQELRARQAELEAQNKVLRYSQAMAESASDWFEALFASVPLSLMVVNEHDIVEQANAMAHRSFQPTEQDRPLISLMPFVSAQHSERVVQAFADAREYGHCEVDEVVFTIAEHSQITGDLHIASIELHQEDAPPQVQFLCAVVDQGPLLTERHALQQRNEQLKASEKRLASVINAALDAVICIDQNHFITVFNPAAATLFKCSTAEALGSPLERFLPGIHQAIAFAQYALRSWCETTGRTLDGKKLSLEMSLSIERQAEGEITTLFVHDITPRKQAEARRLELEAQLRRSQKMQAVGTMAGGIAHDFNNIVSAILGNVTLAQSECAAGSLAMESLIEIDKAGRRARDLVRQILTFSRNEEPKRSALRMAEVIHDTERLLRVTLPPAIEMQVEIAADLPTVMADPTQVQQALMNLCTNAIQALGNARGAVRVHAAASKPQPRVCERLGIPPGNYLAISVTDNGPGMDAHTLERLFEPFFTTKPVGQGTGLGLAVVHGVMRTHGGVVDVQSQPGQGSCFTLYFPVAEIALPAEADPAPPSAKAPSALPASATGGRRQHVMYVDDDEALVFLVKRVLTRRGYQVSAFNDPHAATAALRADPGGYDLLVTDYNMPGYSGVDLLRDARSIRADLPVALASGYITAEIEQAALAEGARALIHKPNDVEELCATVYRLLNGHDSP